MTTDTAVMALLEAVPNLIVHDGYVEVDEENKVIEAEMPYVVFYSTTPRDNDERFGGRPGGSVDEFQITGVGETREQAKVVLKAAHDAVSRKRVGRGLIRRDEANLPVRRDDDYTRPGGEPIFYGVNRYAVAV